MNYDEFIRKKQIMDVPTGIPDPGAFELHPALFDYQRDIVRWALRRGRACVWAECGLGKTFIQLEWARIVHAFTGKPVLILAPLAVSEQTAHDEAPKLGICVNICKSQDDVRNGICITNYERIGAFKFSEFGGVVADESSIIKNSSGKIRNAIIGAVSRIPFRLACTATPAPNDFMELGNHAEFVGAMGYAEMLAMFFVHDGGDTAKWRLKGHARKAFFEWVATWAVMIRKPSDLGYSDEGFQLPEMRIHEVVVKTDAPDGYLFPVVALTLHERFRARRDSVHERAAMVDRIIRTVAPDDQWCVWANLNDESSRIAALRSDMRNVQGADSIEYKVETLTGFARGSVKELVSKPKIAGMGMNFQRIHRCVFIGLSDSFEQYYQAVRRFWRFGQIHPVDVYIVTADTEGAVVENIKRKEREANQLYSEMSLFMREINVGEIRATSRNTTDYNPEESMTLPVFLKGA